jgi:DNA polymerase III delta prime subunit
MATMLEKVSRYLPLILLITAIAALLQVALQVGHVFSSQNIGVWLNRNSNLIWWIVAGACFVAWTLVVLAYLRHTNRLPARLTKWKTLMDILDRLTNRREVERRIDAQPEALYIDAEALAETLRSKVVGQDRVCLELATQIRRRLALEHRGKPIGVFLFAGPPGSGKTYLGKTLADAVGRKLLHFDMTQFSSGSFASTSLFGAARGYVGSNTYGKLTAGLRDTPDAVVLLDEFEKAHSDVHKNFLTAWNDGFITEASDGQQISTTRSLFVLTTNAAVDALAGLAREYADNPDELRRAADAVLRAAGFAPEVLSRIDRIFVFEPLSGLNIARVAALEIESMIQGYGLEIGVGGINPQILLDLSTKEAVKTIARGMPGVSGVTNARVYYPPRAAAGAPSARHSLRPLYSGRMIHAQFGHIAPRECVSVSVVIACDKREAFAQGSEATKQSILSLRGEMDCFANARNDGFKMRGCLKFESVSADYAYLSSSPLRGASCSGRQNGLLRNFEPLSPYRHGRSIALVIPIRTPARTSTLRGRAYSAIGGASSASPLCAWVMARASVSLPGPEHSDRSSCIPRRRRMAGMPWVGCKARISTAAAEPSFSQTKLTHQWMP